MSSIGSAVAAAGSFKRKRCCKVRTALEPDGRAGSHPGRSYAVASPTFVKVASIGTPIIKDEQAAKNRHAFPQGARRVFYAPCLPFKPFNQTADK
jgi:hypothetical protein